MRDLIAAELKRTPELSDNWLAQILGTTDKTVASVRGTDRNFGDSEVGCTPWQGRQVSPCDPDHDPLRQGCRTAQEALQILGDNAPRRTGTPLAERAKRVQKLEMIKGHEVRSPGDGDIRLFHCPFQKLEEIAGIKPNSVILF